MKNYKKIVLFTGLLASVFVLFACDEETTGNHGDTTLHFLPIELGGAFWSSMTIGAESMAEELGYDIVVAAAAPHDPQRYELQIGFVRNAIADGNVGAISLAAWGPDILNPVAQEAREAGIPLITFDSDVADEENRLSFVGTDNFDAGVILGEQAAQMMLDAGITEGPIAMSLTNASLTVFINRTAGIHEGFNRIMGDHAGNFTWLETIVCDNQSAEAQRQLEGQIVANPDMVAVFSLGAEGPTTGVMSALRTQGKGGQILHFGFDYTDTWLTGVDEGLITAIVDQDAFTIGQEVVRVMAQLAEGKEVARNYSVPVTWVLAEDIQAHGEAIQERINQ
jgi:ribose transport system substrate-binding protein